MPTEAGFRPATARITFAADGSYEGSDGCNRELGLFTLRTDGSVVGGWREGDFNSAVACGHGNVEYGITFSTAVDEVAVVDDEATFTEDGAIVLVLQRVD